MDKVGAVGYLDRPQAAVSPVVPWFTKTDTEHGTLPHCRNSPNTRLGHFKPAFARKGATTMNPSVPNLYLGIDVSKDWFDAYLLPTGQSWHVSTKLGEPERWIKELPAPICLAVLEATGGLEKQIAAALHQAAIPVAIVNPKRIHFFAKALDKKAKTDSIAAQTIAQFAQHLKPTPKPMSSTEQQNLNELMMRRSQLIDNLIAEQNRLASVRCKSVRSSISKHLRWLQKQLKDIDELINQAIKNSPIWLANEQLLSSVPGVGNITARSLLAHMPELGSLSRRQVAALAGLAPHTRQSGKWKGKAFISGGRANVRKTLYMAALSASRYNPAIKPFYLHLLKQGKSPKMALTACMRKLLTMLNAIIRDQKSWSFANL